ncbi:MAG: hypothetical protein H6719_11235 [Sandaracinaceae bacterium]|nr:hypothetical protein [Sandaracinaceae bacterium]
MIERRTFLTSAAAAGAATLSAPAWISRAFAQEGDNGRDRAAELRDLSAAYRRAQQQGRPLLVLVVPEDGGARWERAHAFGELLNHGTDATLTNLAMAEVACSTMTSLRRLVPQAGDGEPWMVLVEPDQHPAVARRIAVELPENPSQWTDREQPDYEQRVESAIDQRMAILSASLEEAIAGDAEMIARRARVAEHALDAALVQRVHAAIRRGTVPAELLEAAPAIVRAGARDRAPVLAQLAENARERLVRRPLPGSYWATSWGCGVTVEGRDDNVMVGCGMGHVPERSRRFLYWYTSPASMYE